MSKISDLVKELFSENCNQDKIDTAYLAIDYSQKTGLVDTYGNTIAHTRSWRELLQFTEKRLTERIP